MYEILPSIPLLVLSRFDHCIRIHAFELKFFPAGPVSPNEFPPVTLNLKVDNGYTFVTYSIFKGRI